MNQLLDEPIKLKPVPNGMYSLKPGIIILLEPWQKAKAVGNGHVLIEGIPSLWERIKRQLAQLMR